MIQIESQEVSLDMETQLDNNKDSDSAELMYSYNQEQLSNPFLHSLEVKEKQTSNDQVMTNQDTERPPLQVLGIIRSSDNRRAIIQVINQTSQVQIVKEGSAVDGLTDSKIIKITNQQLTINYQSQNFSYELGGGVDE
ncbi:MAG: hypothetical protein ACQEQI_08315 [Bacillota bacterium]